MYVNVTDQNIADLPTPAKGYKLTYYPGHAVDGFPLPQGFAVRVTAAGTRSFLLCYRDETGEHRATIGQVSAMKLAQAARKAKEMRYAIGKGGVVPKQIAQRTARVEAAKTREAAAAGAITIGDVLDGWINAHGHLRSIDHRAGTINRHIRPALGAIATDELKKRPIVAMVDRIRAEVGPAAANYALSVLIAVLNWHEARADDWRPPALRGLRIKTASRDRILTHEEIATLWPLFGATGEVGLLCKLLLLTGQRRSEWGDASWREISDDGLLIPARRYKTGRDHFVPLSAAVRDLLAALPRRPGSDRLFTSTLGGGFDRGKRKLDALAPLPHWTLHDLRRTATSLMIEAGVRPDYVERVTRPTITGIAGVSNRYAYIEEKRMALDALAEIVGRIISPPSGGNVVPLRA